MALGDDGAAGAGGGFGGAADLLGDAGAAGGDGDGQSGDGAGSGDGSGDNSGDQQGSGGADPDWYASLSADPGEGEKASLRDWVKALGVKDLDGLAKVARDNQAALRDTGRIKIPGDGASPAEIAAFRSAIGVPEDASGYQLPMIEDAAGNAVPLDDGLLGKLVPRALEHGVPKAAFEGLVSDFVGLQLDAAAHEDAAQKDLARAWLGKQGENGNARMAAIDAAGKALGLSGTDMVAIRNTLGADRAMEMFAKLGEGMAEDVMITGGRGRFGISGREAQAEMDKLKGDKEFYTKMMVPGSPEKLRWDRLQAAAGEWEEQQRRAAA